jgi:4-azaleucine resistance transporter AzlC
VREGYATGAKLIAPITVAALAFGVSFGVLARTAHMGVVAPIVMSATTFAGSAQFAVASILDNGGSVAAAIVAAILLNARYAPIGITVASGFDAPLPLRIIQAQFIVDESWAVSTRGRRFDVRVLIGAGALLFVGWVGGTALGVLVGDLFGDPERAGLDGAFPALFLAILAPWLATRRAATAAAVAAAIAFVLIPFTAPGIPIIAASAACLLGWRR